MDYAASFKKNQTLATAQSLSSNFASSSVSNGEIKEIRSYCVFALITGAAALNGTFKLQASPDGSNWADIANTSVTVTALTGSANYLIVDPIPLPAYPYVQLVWTSSSGSGTLNAFLSCKQ